MSAALMEPVPRPMLDVIVVDDEPSSRSGLKLAVAALGHKCRTAADGEEAWELLKQQPADVVISDWRMPRLDGVELCKRVRDADGEDVPYTYFILLTAHSEHEHRMSGMRAGADDFLGKPLDLDQLEARLFSAARVTALHAKLREKQSVLRRESAHSFRVARVDALTGIPNRRSLQEDLGDTRDACIAMCDVDHFKDYNDSFGHLAGDEVLRHVAEAIKSTLRRDDAVYRYGGEEFTILLKNEPLAYAVPALERVRQAVEQLAIPAPGGGVVTISIGVSLCKDDAPQALERADAAVYRAKSRGRNCVEVSS